MAWTSTKPINPASYLEWTTLPPFVYAPYTIDSFQELPVLPTSGQPYAYVDASGTFVVERVTLLSLTTVTTSGVIASEIVAIEALHTAGPFVLTTDDYLDETVKLAIWTATDSLSMLSTLTVRSTLGWSTIQSASTPTIGATSAETSAIGTVASIPPTATPSHDNSNKQRLLAIEIALPIVAVLLLLVVILLFKSIRQRRSAQDSEHAANACNDAPPSILTDTKPYLPSSPSSSTALPTDEQYAKVDKETARLPEIAEAHNEGISRQTASHELFDEESLGMRPHAKSSHHPTEAASGQSQHLQPNYKPYRPPASPAVFDAVRDETIRSVSSETAPKASMEVSPVQPQSHKDVGFPRL